MNKVTYKEGEVVGSCKLLREVFPTGSKRRAIFQCPICDNEFESRIDHVKGSKTNSCGCLSPRELHGESNTRLYHIWEGMKQRCINNKSPNYINYGARGITICSEWIQFTGFRDWAINNDYSDNLSIERVDVDGNYCPSNCCWASMEVQQANKRFGVNKAGFTGVTIDGNSFRARILISGKKVHIGTFPTALHAAVARDKYILENNLPHKLNFKGHLWVLYT